MLGIENKAITLMLNSNWQKIGYKLVGDAITDLCAGNNSKAVEINYRLDEDGNPIYDDYDYVSQNLQTFTWDEWIKRPIRSWDLTIKSVKMEIRVPTVLVAKNYAKMPTKSFKGKPSKESIWIRDKGVDQYTGEKLRREDATVDHIIPKFHNGKDVWENLVLTSKKINNKKGNKFNHEVGLKLIRTPRAPLSIPISALITEAKHPDWMYFMEK